VERLLFKYDDDKNGALDFSEFTRFMRDVMTDPTTRPVFLRRESLLRHTLDPNAPATAAAAASLPGTPGGRSVSRSKTPKASGGRGVRSDRGNLNPLSPLSPSAGASAMEGKPLSGDLASATAPFSFAESDESESMEG